MKSFLSSWLGHIGGYVAAGAGIVAAINPTFLPPIGKLAVGVASLVVIASHNAYKVGTLTAAVNAAAGAIQKVPPVAVVTMLALAMVFGGGLSGCATIQSFLGSPAAVPVEQAVVLVAV